MSDDGADLGVSAERALGTVLGGKPSPEKDEQMDPVQFEAWIMSHTSDLHSYEGTAAYAAKLILDHFRAHPEDTSIPTEPKYLMDKKPDGTDDWDTWRQDKSVRNLTDVMFEYPEFKALDLTGFMWGWAVNAARRCCELPSVPNPAIVTIGG